MSHFNDFSSTFSGKLIRRISWLYLFGMFAVHSLSGQAPFQQKSNCDEVLIFVRVSSLQTFEVPAMICDDRIYLPVSELFNFLQIKVVATNQFQHLSGFVISPDSSFTIDLTSRNIKYRKRDYELPPEDVISTPTELYMLSEHFGEVFDLHADFNFRNLQVTITPGFELPQVRAGKLARLHSQLHYSDFAPDTIIRGERELFHLNTSDWQVIIDQQSNGKNYSRAQISLGGMLAGGEFTTLINYDNIQHFRERNQYYLWRYVNNENPIIRQVKVGKIPVNSIFSIFHPVVGIQVTNARSYNRKSFSTYYLSNYTSPGWTVELYVNNVLVAYTKADATGLFEFDVPVGYGSTEVMLRHYGPYGEEQTSRRIFNVPFTFVPMGELQYKASAGIVQDKTGKFISRGEVNYGLFNKVTLGGGMEYLSSPDQSVLMPFVTSSINLAPGVMFTNEYVQGVRYKTLISYYTPGNLRLEINYKRYEKEQEAVRYNYNEERAVTVSLPYRWGQTHTLSRLTYSNNKLNNLDFKRVELFLAGASQGFSANITTFALIRQEHLSAYSNFTVGLPSIKGWLLISRLQYQYDKGKCSSARMELRRSVFKNGFLQMSYEKQFYPASSYYLQIGLRYNFSFGQAGTSITHSNHFSSANITASGSILHEPELDYSNYSRHTNLGLASIMFKAFLDISNNGIRDTGETYVPGLGVHMNGGRRTYQKEGDAVVILGLEPYRSYFVELNAHDLPLAWRIEKPRLQIYLSAHNMKLLEVPVVVVGEASGSVYTKEGETQKGVGRIKVSFYDRDSTLVASQFSEGDGYFSYLGLAPGEYTARIDSAQLRNLNMHSIPASIAFNIRGTEEGDIVDTIDFILLTAIEGEGDEEMLESASDTVEENSQLPLAKMNISIPSVLSDEKPGSPGSTILFRVQLIASSKKIALSDPYFHNISNVQEYKHQAMFKYTTGEFATLEEAMALKQEMRTRGFPGSFITAFRGQSRVSLQEAINTTNTSSLAQFEGVVFKVQVLARKTRLLPDHTLYQNERALEEYFHKGMYKYSFGNTRSLKEAIELQNELHNNGHKGAFVIAFQKGQRISLEQAISEQGK